MSGPSFEGKFLSPSLMWGPCVYNMLASTINHRHLLVAHHICILYTALEWSAGEHHEHLVYYHRSLGRIP